MYLLLLLLLIAGGNDNYNDYDHDIHQSNTVSRTQLKQFNLCTGCATLSHYVTMYCNCIYEKAYNVKHVDLLLVPF